MPQTCNCGAKFTVDHAMICHMGGFPTIRHNEIRDITATLLTEVCSNVNTEATLQPLSGEQMSNLSANTDDGARVDIRARGFWNTSQDSFFLVTPLQLTESTNKQRNVNTGSASEKSSMECSPLWYSRQQVAWDEKLQLSTDALLT